MHEDTTSVPTTETASVDPLASVALYDIAADSPTYLQRRPFDLILKDEKNRDYSDAHGPRCWCTRSRGGRHRHDSTRW